jgi:hypothetical protein
MTISRWIRRLSLHTLLKQNNVFYLIGLTIIIKTK